MFRAEEHIESLNELKRALIKDEYVNRGELITGLKACGLPINGNFIAAMSEVGIFIRTDKQKVVWANDKPIHFKMLQRAYLQYQKKRNAYMREYMRSYKKDNVNQEIEDAINLLKKHGYIILSQQEDLYKKL